MEQSLTAKLQILPNADQQQTLLNTMSAYLQAYRFFGNIMKDTCKERQDRQIKHAYAGRDRACLISERMWHQP